MTTSKKLTKRDHFTTLLNLSEVKANPVLVDFIEHELELLAKKNSAEKKPTAAQVAIKDAIYNNMQENRLYTITELIKEVPECAELSNQRVSALVRQMYDCAEPVLERVEEKRKAYFRKIAE